MNKLKNAVNKIAYIDGFILSANEDGVPHLNSKIIAKVDECDPRNMVTICKCVNMHDELLEALLWAKERILKLAPHSAQENMSEYNLRMFALMQMAIAKAQGGEG